ncbi:MAG: hypothetical protein FAF05_02110 [Epsilonproteobacteria bacterium]|nr:hypothetical protein [Campylobacterota bacterium]
MKQESYELFAAGSVEQIVKQIGDELEKRNESPFWKEKVAPFSKAILSVLIPLRDNGILFDPQGDKQERLTPELFFEWSDFVSLKMLLFTITASNEVGVLQRTKLSEEDCAKYQEIDLEKLASYLGKYSVNLENEAFDFPIANYNLHQGVSNVIKSLL